MKWSVDRFKETGAYRVVNQHGQGVALVWDVRDARTISQAPDMLTILDEIMGGKFIPERDSKRIMAIQFAIRGDV